MKDKAGADDTIPREHSDILIIEIIELLKEVDLNLKNLINLNI